MRTIVAAATAASLACSLACSSLAEHDNHNTNLPNAEAGPFREIDLLELGAGRAAPYTLHDNDHFERNAAVMDADGSLATLEAWAYAARTLFPEGAEPDASVPPNEIVRHVAVDARSFTRPFDVVLSAEQPWEMGTIDAPAAVRVGSEVWLYYAAGQGIGAARGDGLHFTRASDAPVLGPAGGWEAGAVPTSPCVLAHPDGRLHMYYAVALASGSAIGEARSRDGLTWERLGDGPLLGPGTLLPADTSAAGPSALVATSSEGRVIEYLYYGARAGDEVSIGLAARFDGAGPFQLAAAPVFSGSLAPTEPTVLRYDGYSLLFVTEKAGTTVALDYPAIAVGVAPANVTLAPPEPP